MDHAYLIQYIPDNILLRGHNVWQTSLVIFYEASFNQLYTQHTANKPFQGIPVQLSEFFSAHMIMSFYSLDVLGAVERRESMENQKVLILNAKFCSKNQEKLCGTNVYKLLGVHDFFFFLNLTLFVFFLC